ncbi:MAG: lysostaphin resistance A-like protein [Saprospiraceae bacterium]
MESEQNNSLFSSSERVEMPLVVSMLLLFLTISVFGLVGFGLIRLLGMLFDIDIAGLMSGLSDNSTSTDRNFLRTSILINHLTMIVLPGIVFTIFSYRKGWLSFLNLNKSPQFINLFGGVILLLVSMPFVQFLFWVNKNWIPLPSWARTMEASTADTISNLLTVDASYEFFFNVLIIALIPALGEELIFRGIIQKEVTKGFRNSIVGIWVAALIFSAFHFQFEGFMPRLVLGALLGYLYYWSNNLWVPILAHFMNNFLQILAQFLFQKEISDMDLDSLEMPPTWQWLFSLTLIFALGYYLQQYNYKNSKTFSNPSADTSQSDDTNTTS